MSNFELALARDARLFEGEVVVHAAREWAHRNSTNFFRLKPSEIATMMQSILQCHSKKSVVMELKKHIDGRVKRQKGASPWARPANRGTPTMLNDLLQTIDRCVAESFPMKGKRDGQSNPVEDRLARTLQGKELETLHEAREHQAVLQFLVTIVKLHQSAKIFTAEENRCRKSLDF